MWTYNHYKLSNNCDIGKFFLLSFFLLFPFIRCIIESDLSIFFYCLGGFLPKSVILRRKVMYILHPNRESKLCKNQIDK